MSMYRCAACGSSSVVKDTKKEGFSVGKAVAGGALFGGVGLVAGALGKKNEYYHCGACGQTLTYCMSAYDKDKIDNAIRVKDTNKLKGLKGQYPNIEFNENEKYRDSNRRMPNKTMYIINPNYSPNVTVANNAQMTKEQVKNIHLEPLIMQVLSKENEPLTVNEISLNSPNLKHYYPIDLLPVVKGMVSKGMVLRVIGGKTEQPPVSSLYKTGDYSVILTNVGADRGKVIRTLEKCTGLALLVAKQIADEVIDSGINKPIQENVSKEVAERIKADLESVGASVLIQKNENTVKEDSLDKLKKLKEVLDLGIINQDEYNQKREKLLNEYLEPSNCINEAKDLTCRVEAPEKLDKQSEKENEINNLVDKIAASYQENYGRILPFLEKYSTKEKYISNWELVKLNEKMSAKFGSDWKKSLSDAEIETIVKEAIEKKH